MLKNHLLIALRNIKNQKVFSIINISGLAIGMASTLIILLYVGYEFSYDSYHSKSDRIFRVSREWFNEDGETNLHLGHTAYPFATLIKNDYQGQVEEAVRFFSGGAPLVKYNEKGIIEENFFFADPEIFEVFDWEVITGNPSSALTEPNTLILTETTSEKYFGEEDPVGKSLLWVAYGFELPMEVRAVVKDIPKNSHFTWGMLSSIKTLEAPMGGHDAMMRDWGGNNYSTYLLFKDIEAKNNFESSITAFLDKHLPRNEENPDYVPSDYNNLNLMNIQDIHLKSHLDSEIGQNGDIEVIYIFLIVAILILVIACINFMNLSTARSIKRAKEVGLRKVMGAVKSTLIRQFLLESILYAVISMIIACVTVYGSLPLFSSFTGKQLTFELFNDLNVLLMMGGMIIIVGVIAGSYPAFYLSRYQPATILKGEYKSVGSNVNIRSVLVVFQFMISAILIISVGIVQSQLNFVKTKPLGFNQTDVVLLPGSRELLPKFDQIKRKLESHPGITNVSLGSRVPSGRLLDSQGGKAEVNGEMITINFRIADVHVDFDYLESLEVPLVAGRYFNSEKASDSTQAFIINEATVRTMGWNSNEDAVGKQFNYGSRNGYIIGVLKDFHFESLHQSISPIVFMITQNRINTILVRIDPAQKSDVEKALTEEWSYLRPGYPVDINYLSDSFDAQYEAEDKLSQVIYTFSGLAIFIAILGLYGLASFITSQRIKEIGIRKVLGANINQILILLGKDFAWLILISFILAVPVSLYFMNDWLSNFAYATSMPLWPFIIAFISILVVSLLTISIQTVTAAIKNPVDTLRYE